MSVDRLGEFDLISKIRAISNSPEGVVGIGDDCAVIPQQSGLDTLVSTDMLVEGTHFILSKISAYDLGWKSAAVNISDIAAMGGTPSATFLSFALPSSLSDAWRLEFMRGYMDLSGRFSVPLLGGDTTLSQDRLCINVTVLGTCRTGAARLRSAARPGDKICVTGTLGDSGAGLRVLLEGLGDCSSECETDNLTSAGADGLAVADCDTDVLAGLGCGADAVLLKRHFRPVPRVEEGKALSSCGGVHAMMDISDGVGSDLRHILKASGVCAEVDVRLLPLSPELRLACAAHGWDPVDLALCGGEDYELLFTVDPALEPNLQVPHTVIGEITSAPAYAGDPRPDPSIKWLGTDADYLGFRHF